eukprot:Protomagalhaensia_wolfi_Nauph_80__1397@NODE_1839_length_1313_cov_115_390895_g1438_i0_p1_GENE_NODE_1839_length_1313_cov_115_390895_g1438_i0NODE_1839_length_1313_cov_115_390895_g1438_i0_p1_ORF_typecomplete_len106_score8_61_NODE_1839_length_1313_cov_115_390895_g1438_i0672989
MMVEDIDSLYVDGLYVSGNQCENGWISISLPISITKRFYQRSKSHRSVQWPQYGETHSHPVRPTRRVKVVVQEGHMKVVDFSIDWNHFGQFGPFVCFQILTFDHS